MDNIFIQSRSISLMDFSFSTEQTLIKDEVRRFAETEMAPVSQEHDRNETYPYDVMKKAADMGLTGSHIPVEFGGSSHSPIDYAIIVEELSAVDPGIGLCIYSAGFGADTILAFGTDEQKEKYLPLITSGKSVMGSAISESGAGSDVTSISTLAEEDGDDWVLNGRKMWITNGTVGDFFVVMCKTDPDDTNRYSGFSQIIVEKGTAGFSAEKITGKLGIRASDTAELIFDNARVPKENLVGTRGAGFLQLMQFFDESRTMVSAQAVGIAQGACEQSLAYAKERNQFGRPISDFQAIQHKLADMYTLTEAARNLTFKSAWIATHEKNRLTALASMAKEYSSRIAVQVTSEAIQVHGGAGYVDDFGVSKLYRDAKITQIYEGTSEIQKNIIARELLGKGFI